MRGLLRLSVTAAVWASCPYTGLRRMEWEVQPRAGMPPQSIPVAHGFDSSLHPRLASNRFAHHSLPRRRFSRGFPVTVLGRVASGRVTRGQNTAPACAAGRTPIRTAPDAE